MISITLKNAQRTVELCLDERGINDLSEILLSLKERGGHKHLRAPSDGGMS